MKRHATRQAMEQKKELTDIALAIADNMKACFEALEEAARLLDQKRTGVDGLYKRAGELHACEGML